MTSNSNSANGSSTNSNLPHIRLQLPKMQWSKIKEQGNGELLFDMGDDVLSINDVADSVFGIYG